MTNPDHSAVLLFLISGCLVSFGRGQGKQEKAPAAKRKGQAAMSEERTGCGLDLERREPSASTTEAVTWEATLGAERTRGVYTEALAHVFDFWAGLVCWFKNCDKGEPRELAGELYTAAVGCVAVVSVRTTA